MKLYSVELVIFSFIGLTVVLSKDSAMSFAGGGGGVDVLFFMPIAIASVVHMIIVASQGVDDVIYRLHLCMFQMCLTMWWVYLFIYASSFFLNAYSTVFFSAFYEVTSAVSLSFLTIYILLMGGAVSPRMWKQVRRRGEAAKPRRGEAVVFIIFKPRRGRVRNSGQVYYTNIHAFCEISL